MAQDLGDRLRSCRVIANPTLAKFCYDSIVDTLPPGQVVAPSPVPAPNTIRLTPPPAPAAPVAPIAATPAAPVTPPTPRAAPPVPAAPVPAAVPAVPAQAVPTQAKPVAPAVDKFGEENLRAQNRPNDDLPDTIQARITAVAADPYGAAILTLDNGQIWKQSEGEGYRVAKGTTVTIKKGMLGAYFLSAANSSRSVKVKRTR